MAQTVQCNRRMLLMSPYQVKFYDDMNLDLIEHRRI
jgi:hypothetical protein